MPGKHLSLVCCWGPGEFHFPEWICCESFGGGQVCTSFKFCLYGNTGLIFKRDSIIINHLLELSGTRVKYLDHGERAYKHEIWSYRISEKPLIIAHSGVSRETRWLKVAGSLLQLAYFVMREAKSLARACVHAGSSEPSPHADVIRTCADQFIVLIFHCGPLFYFIIQYYNLNN